MIIEGLKDVIADYSDIHDGKKEKLRRQLRDISQPAITAVQIGIVELLKSWGIISTKVVGHSSSEFAAAYTVGSLSL